MTVPMSDWSEAYRRGLDDVIGPVQKYSHVQRFTPEEYTDALQEACTYMGIDWSGLSDEAMHQRIDERRNQLFADIRRRFDAAFPTTPDQLAGHPLVQLKEIP